MARMDGPRPTSSIAKALSGARLSAILTGPARRSGRSCRGCESVARRFCLVSGPGPSVPLVIISPMTTVDILFRYTAPPTETQAFALANARDVYGIRGISFDHA